MPVAVVNPKFVAKKFVVVADVPVAFAKVKFWRVLDPVTRRLGMVRSPERERFEKLAFVAKKFVVVAFVVVLFCAVKFWRVEEPRALNVPDGKI